MVFICKGTFKKIPAQIQNIFEKSKNFKPVLMSASREANDLLFFLLISEQTTLFA